MSIAISGSSITFPDLTQMSTAVGGSFRNRVINGDMRIDQRNAGVAYAITSSLYGSCDRWGSLAGANGVWTQQRVATGSTNFPFATRVQRVAGSTSNAAGYIGQVIETTNCQDLAGQTITVSYYATAGANFSAASSIIYPTIDIGTGTDQGWGSLNAATWTGYTAISSATQAITTTRTRYSITVTVPAGTNEIGVRFAAIGTGTAGANDWFQITGVQLEAGSTATEFERRPIGTELALCQRYYQKTYELLTAPGTVTTIGAINYIATGAFQDLNDRLMVEMRGVPSTVQIFNPATGTAGQVRNYTNSTNYTATINSGAGQTSSKQTQFRTSVPATSANELTYHLTVDAEL